MVRMRRGHYEEIIGHATEGQPNEVCGILSGSDHTVTRVYRGTNTASEPRVRYEMDPRQQFDVMQKIEADEESMVAIYHSHPRSPAFPSRIDRELAFYPDCAYVIVSLTLPEAPIMRAFRIKDDQVEEEEVVVVD
jgi:[CysO sulfur-carrier protein]-S-L-cysteine hydrolase